MAKKQVDTPGADPVPVEPVEAAPAAPVVPAGPVTTEVVRAVRLFKSGTSEAIGYTPVICRKVDGVIKTVQKFAFPMGSDGQPYTWPGEQEALAVYEAGLPEVEKRTV